MQQHRFRIDREPDPDPALQRWRARTFHDGICSEFSILVNFERLTVDLNGLRFAFQVLGMKLSRELSNDSQDEDALATGRFRASPGGSWTVLELFMPGEEVSSCRLGLNANYGQGVLVARGLAERGMLLTRILGPVLASGRSQEMGLVARSPARTV